MIFDYSQKASTIHVSSFYGVRVPSEARLELEFARFKSPPVKRAYDCRQHEKSVLTNVLLPLLNDIIHKINLRKLTTGIAMMILKIPFQN